MTEQIFGPENNAMNPVGYAEAINICKFHLNDSAINIETKALAIHKIVSMETINAVSKQILIGIMLWLGYSRTTELRKMKKEEVVGRIREMWIEAFEWKGGDRDGDERWERGLNKGTDIGANTSGNEC